MKPRFEILIVLALLLGGCVSKSNIAPVAPPLPASTLHSLSSEIVLPPPAPDIVLHFIYPVLPLTNGYLQSSTDLVHWVYRYDFTNDAKGDWYLTNHADLPDQFFRAGGDTIP